MRTEPIQFYSRGARVQGFIRLPDEHVARPLPVIVQGPGWLGLAESKLYEPWQVGFCEAGYAFLAFNYRGFGGSEGERGWILPDEQVEDFYAALTYVETREDLDATRIGLFGLGGLGAGNAIIVAGTDTRVKAIAIQNVVAEGADWMRRMRREHEWRSFQERVQADARRAVLEGKGEMVDPREELMVATPERRAMTLKADVDSKMAPQYYLQSAAAVLRYRPIDYVDRISPRAILMTRIENDTVVQTEHAQWLYEKAGAPKKLITLRNTSHYGQYDKYFHILHPQMLDWFDRYVRSGPVDIIEDRGGTAERSVLSMDGSVVLQESL